jgi:hypothetical protein
MMKIHFCVAVVLYVSLLVPFAVEAASPIVPSAVLNIRAEAELFYATNGTYQGICELGAVKAVLKKERYTCKAAQNSYVLIKSSGKKNIPCADATGYKGIVAKKPKLSGKGPFLCGASSDESGSTPSWSRSIVEKLKTPVATRHEWSGDINHKYYQQVFWELRGESYSWKHDVNKGSYTGICKRKDLAGGYMGMMKKDGLKNIECGDSASWFYVKATMPNGWNFCLNRNDKNDNDSKEVMENCAQAKQGAFTNVVRVR